jgi:hypothetical protein
MSFDLGVWYSESTLTDKEAADVYLRLCEDWPYLDGENSAVAAFYEELTEHWPEIDTIPEEKIGEMEYCPWSCALDHSGMAVVMPCVWPMAEKVATFVQGLASKHRLVLFDPQSSRVYLPEQLIAKKRSLLRRLFGGPEM